MTSDDPWQPWQPNQPYKLPDHYSHSSLETYGQCPRKFELSRLQGWRSKRTARSLSYGSAWHEGLAIWYRTSLLTEEELREHLVKLATTAGTSTDIISKLTKQQIREEITILVACAALPDLLDSEANDHRTYKLLEEQLRCYAKVYSYEPWKVRQVEADFAFDLPGGIPIYGRCDLIIDWKDKVLPVEHKTTSSIYNYGENFNVNQQVDIELLGLQSLIESASDTMMVNAVFVSTRKAGSKAEDFQRYPDITRSPTQLQEAVVNMAIEVDDIKSDLARGYFPMKKSSCNSYGGCPYRRVCEVAPEERHLILDAFYEQTPPHNINKKTKLPWED